MDSQISVIFGDIRYRYYVRFIDWSDPETRVEYGVPQMEMENDMVEVKLEPDQ